MEPPLPIVKTPFVDAISLRFVVFEFITRLEKLEVAVMVAFTFTLLVAVSVSVLPELQTTLSLMFISPEPL